MKRTHDGRGRPPLPPGEAKARQAARADLGWQASTTAPEGVASAASHPDRGAEGAGAGATGATEGWCLRIFAVNHIAG
jgi:hypothetical protein